MSTYADFLARKSRVHSGSSLQNLKMPPQLFDWQQAVARWAMKKGRAALFADCGLGKTAMQLSWANNVPGRVLILAPLCVAEQTVAEGQKFGVDIVYARSQPETAGARIVITNYERLDGFHADAFDGVVLDESSILKAFDGKTRKRLIETFADTPYRLCCTATPSPNDIAELANHAEFLGLMTRAEFLATWFVHDDKGWRMKGHARTPFYRWLASWAVALRTPSDIGYSDDGFVLPPLTITDHIVEGGDNGGVLFPELGLKGITGRQKARRASVEDRCAAAHSLVLKSFHGEGKEGCLQPRVAEKKQGLGEGVLCGSGEQGAAARMGEESIPHEQSVQGQGDSASQSVCGGTSESKEAGQYQTLRPDVRGIRSDGFDADDMRDLRNIIGEQEDFSARGPLPQDRQNEIVALRELQSRTGQVQGRSGVTSSSGALPGKPQWLIWCGLNAEQDLMEKLLGDECVSIHGGTPYNEKVRLLGMWLRGEKTCLLSKIKVLGFGMNFQNCHNVVFVGIGDSYEQYYQAIRRCWRFGQKAPVEAHIVVSDIERAVVSNVRRKQAEADEMSSQIIAHMRDFEREELAS